MDAYFESICILSVDAQGRPAKFLAYEAAPESAAAAARAPVAATGEAGQAAAAALAPLRPVKLVTLAKGPGGLAAAGGAGRVALQRQKTRDECAVSTLIRRLSFMPIAHTFLERSFPPKLWKLQRVLDSGMCSQRNPSFRARFRHECC
jgi:hypothetical protein